MNYAQLKFPPYEWFKKLPLKKKVIRHPRHGEPFEEEEHCEYYITLFKTPTSVYARFTYNEDDQKMIVFDVMEGGYCEQNRLGKALKFTKENYKKICAHAQSVYEQFQRELLADRSYLWETKVAEDLEENN